MRGFVRPYLDWFEWIEDGVEVLRERRHESGGDRSGARGTGGTSVLLPDSAEREWWRIRAKRTRKFRMIDCGCGERNEFVTEI